MPTKYILKPDGTAIQSDGSSVEKIKDITKEQTSFSSDRDNLFNPSAEEVTGVLLSDSLPGDNNLLNSNVKDKLTNVIENNPNFNFMGGARETINSFKQMYSFEDATNASDFTVNDVFATEFEMLTAIVLNCKNFFHETL